MSSRNAEAVQRVSITRLTAGSRTFDAIEVVIGGLHLRCDLTNDRQVRLAQRLAVSNRADFIVNPELAERVATALAANRKGIFHG